MRKTIQTVVVLVGLTQAFSACRGRDSGSPAPMGPTPAPSAPTGSQPRISAITPKASTTLGNGWGVITGTGFASGLRVWFGSAEQKVLVNNAQTIRFWGTSAHEAGTVDVIVRNSGGREDRLVQGFTFAPPESFDFNGSWAAYAGDDYGADMRFVIDHDKLMSLTCGSSLAIAFAEPPAVSGGQFSFVGDDGLKVSGQIVSDINAIGEINVPPCAPTWWGDKSTATQFAR